MVIDVHTCFMEVAKREIWMQSVVVCLNICSDISPPLRSLDEDHNDTR
jgi:hypothetical protein